MVLRLLQGRPVNQTVQIQTDLNGLDLFTFCKQSLQQVRIGEHFCVLGREIKVMHLFIFDCILFYLLIFNIIPYNYIIKKLCRKESKLKARSNKDNLKITRNLNINNTTKTKKKQITCVRSVVVTQTTDAYAEYINNRARIGTQL